MNTTSGDAAAVSGPVLQPASGSSAPLRDKAGENRKCDLGWIDGAKVEPDRALDAGDDVFGDTLGAQRLEVVAGVAAAPDQPDEAGLSGSTSSRAATRSSASWLVCTT